MAKKVPNVVGIDIGSQKIKIVEIKARGNAADISAIDEIETPEGAVDHTGIYNPEAVGDALKTLLTRCGSTSKIAVVSVAGQASVLVRTLEVPRMSEEELRSHMEWEINRNIPFAESTVMSAYETLADTDPNSPNMEVVMAISPQSAIDNIVTVLQRAKRMPLGVDVEPLALARVLVSMNEHDYAGKVVCVIDIGHKSTSINIYKDGKLMMPRQIPVGGEMFTSAIANGEMIGVAEAEEQKTRHLRVPESEIAAAKAYSANPYGSIDFQTTTSFDPLAGIDNPGAGASADTTGQLQAYNPFADDPLPTNPFLAPAPDDAAVNPFAEPPTASADAVQPNPYAEPAHVNPYADMGTGAADFDPLAALGGEEAAADHGVAAHDAPPAHDPSQGQPGVAAFDPFASPDIVPAANEDPETLRRYNFVRPVMDEFIAEVRRSVDYFRSRSGEVDVMLLTGGGAYLKGLPEYLEASLSLPTTLYNPLPHMGVAGKKVLTGLIDENGAEFVMALGTAMHGMF